MGIALSNLKMVKHSSINVRGGWCNERSAHKGPDKQSDDTKGCLSPCFGFVFLQNVVDEITTVWDEKSEKQLHNSRACDMAIQLIAQQ